MTFTLPDLIEISQSRINKIFSSYFNENSSASKRLQEAMHYAMTNGGKRIRPLLVYVTGHILGADLEKLDGPACAIELIHTYSLIHDDLPAMDNADLRRGKPSCHKAFDEATAILAGDALQPLAFEILTTYPCQLTVEQRLQMVTVLSQACGLNGIAAGQMLDLMGVNSVDALTSLYSLKTAALFKAAIQLGMIAANQHTPILEHFAEYTGLAFQIQDDLLDVHGHPSTTGKPQGLDKHLNKCTYPHFIGTQKTQDKINELFNQAHHLLASFNHKHILMDLLNYLLQRQK